MYKGRAIFGVILLVIFLIIFFPHFMNIMKAEQPGTPDKVALEEAWAEYDWTLPIPNSYAEIEPLNNYEGLFLAQTGSQKWGVIDCYGNERFPFREAEMILNNSENGIYAIQINSFSVANRYNDDILVWGFIDDSGEYIVNPRFDEVQMFTGEYAACRIDDIWHIVNTNDEIVRSFNAGERLQRTGEEGIFWIEGNGFHGIINILTNEYTALTEKILFPETFESVTDASVFDRDSLTATYTYIDEDGNEITDRVFDSFITSKDGYAVVTKDAAIGYKTGIIKLEPLTERTNTDTTDDSDSSNTILNEADENSDSVYMYRCSEMVYKHDAVPTYGSGIVSLNLDGYKINDCQFVLCEDDCALESIVSRCSQGYAPAYSVIKTDEFNGTYKIHKFSFDIPPTMKDDLIEWGDYESTINDIKQYVFYIVEFDDNRYLHLEIHQPEPNDDTSVLDDMIKKVVIEYTPA